MIITLAGTLAANACTRTSSTSSSMYEDGGVEAGTAADAAGAEASLPSTFDWTSTGPLITAVPDARHPILSVKDPSVVFFDDEWHVFATTADANAQWSMVYLSFSDWSEAADAELHYLDENPALRGYHAAPQVFYFAPDDEWYLIFQSGQPQYSTTDDLTDPMSWSTPQDFFPAEPDIVRENKGDGGWLDFWVICDDANCHLFFADDNGHYYRSQTSIDEFPNGFGEPVIAIDGTKSTVFEGGATYRVGDDGGYLTLIEAFGSVGERYYRSFVSDSLDGQWSPWAASIDNPFAARSNVTFEDDDAWTLDVSHGELLRDGYDQMLTIDPTNLRFLYQGVDPSQAAGEYFELPYQLALLTYTETPTVPSEPITSGTSVCDSAVTEATAQVANFDDGTTAGWWGSYDETPGAMHPPLAAEAPGADGTSHALHFSGTGYEDWGANFGTTPGCTDTSQFEGLTVWAKGTSEPANEVHVILQVAASLPVSGGGDCTEDCYSHPRTTITLTPEWQRYDLPFENFVHPGWGVDSAYEGVIMGIAFESAGPDFDIWVDQLELFTEASLEAGPDAGPVTRDAGARQDDSGVGVVSAEGGAVREVHVEAGTSTRDGGRPTDGG